MIAATAGAARNGMWDLIRVVVVIGSRLCCGNASHKAFVSLESFLLKISKNKQLITQF